MAGVEPGWGALPRLTTTPDHTKNTKRLTCVDAYQSLPTVSRSCARGANPLVDLVWSPPPLPGLTTVPIWIDHHYVVLLPIITGRGLNTHNDHKHLTLHPDSGPTRIRLIPTEHTQKKVVGDPPTPRHSVADPHAVATLIHGGRTGPPHPNHIIESVRPDIRYQSILFW